MNNETRIKGLKTRAQKYLARCREIVDKAESQNRDLTSAEEKIYDGFIDIVKQIKEKLDELIGGDDGIKFIDGAEGDLAFGRFLRGQLKTDEISISAKPEPLADPEGRDFARFLKGIGRN